MIAGIKKSAKSKEGLYVSGKILLLYRSQNVAATAALTARTSNRKVIIFSKNRVPILFNYTGKKRFQTTIKSTSRIKVLFLKLFLFGLMLYVTLF